MKKASRARTRTASRTTTRSARPAAGPEAALRRRLARYRAELDAACRVSEALFTHLDSDALIQEALLTALRVVNAESGSVLLADTDRHELVFRHSAGRSLVENGTAMPWDKGIAGWVFRRGKPMVIDQVKGDQRHYGEIDAQLKHVTRDMIVLPLKRWNGDPIGVLEVLNKRRGRFDQDDVALLTIVCAAAASSIERAYWYEEAKLAEVVRFLGDVGHDVKNLLVPVSLGADLLEGRVERLYNRIPAQERAQSDADRNGAKAVLHMFRLSCQRIQQHLKDIANCVKGLTTAPEFAPCRLGAIVDEVLTTLRWSAEECGITLKVCGIEDLPEIEADAHRLFNALYNLVSNGIDAMPKGGTVTVTGDRRPGALVVMVSDTGPGIPPQVLEHLFTRRLKSTKARGTGLGLKIVKDVVEAHGGHITVESRRDAGTTFTFTLPLREASPAGEGAGAR